MIYSNGSKLINLNKCLYLYKDDDTEIRFSYGFKDGGTTLSFSNKEVRDMEFNKIVKIMEDLK